MLGDEFVSVVVKPEQLTVEMTCFSMDATDTLFERFLQENCFTLVGEKDLVHTVAVSTCEAVERLWRRTQVVVFKAYHPKHLAEIESWVIKIMEEAGFKQRTGKVAV